jgi:hypothetical protein
MTNPVHYPQPEASEEGEDNLQSLPPAPEPKRRRRLRSLFWPGFVVGFLLLSFASCGGIVLATGINRIDLANLQSGEQVWTPPAVTPTPEVTPLSAEAPVVGESGGAFSMGQQLFNITSSQVNIRALPGYLSKSPGDIIGQVPPGGAIEVIGGRSSADGLTWWYIRYTAPDGGTIDGWIAEATASGVQILGQ